MPLSTEQNTATPSAICEALNAFVRFFEQLSRQDLARLDTLYAPNARFKDPFNDVRGIAAISRIFEHMFDTLEQPHFVVTGRVQQDEQCFLIWEFRFRFRRFSPDQWQTINGSTHLVFNNTGMVELHRDYWDAAEELYEKLPWVGGLMRWLKHRASQ